MNNFNIEKIEFINSSKCKINGELWCKAEPTAVKAERKPYFPKPEAEQRYYLIDLDGELTSAIWHDDNYDGHQYHILNCWLDKSEAEAYIARYGVYLPDRLTLAIRRWKIEHGVEDRFEWNSGDDKCCPFYDCHKQKWRYDWCQIHRRPAVEYFSNAETIEKCLTDLHEYFDDQLVEWKKGEKND